MKRLMTVSALALVCAGPVAAEMDAREVWAEWEQTSQFLDFDVSVGQVQETETRVVLTGVTLSQEGWSETTFVEIPQLTIDETPEGGVVATIVGDGTLRVEDNEPGLPIVMAMDLTLDGAALTLLEGDAISVQFAAPALGAVLTDANDGDTPLALTGSISVQNVRASYSDTMFSAPVRMIDVSGGFEGLTGEMNGSNIDDVAELAGALDVASLSFEGTLDAPMEVFEDFFVPDGRLISDMVVALGAASMSFDMTPMEEDSYAAEVEMAFSLDGFSIAHDVFVPLDERDYFNGQDLVADDLEGFVEYALSGLQGQFSSRDDYSFYEDEETLELVEFSIAPTSLGGRIAVDAGGLLTRAIQGQLGFDFAYEERWGDADAVDVSRVAVRVVDLTTDQLAQAPLDNAMMLYMQGLPEGISWTEAYSVAEVFFDYEESYDQGSEWAYASSASGVANDLGLSFDLSQARVDGGLSLATASGAFLENGMPEPVTGEMTGLDLDFSMPVNTGAGSAPYSVQFGLGSLVLGDALWAMADPQGLLDRGPISAQADISGEMRATTNPMALATFGIGMSPFVAENMSFSLALAAVGATVQGIGDFATERAITEGVPPVGSAEFSGTGLDGVLAAMGQLGVMSPGELEEAEFLLEAFTSQDASGTRRMQVEINDQEHLIVNGQRMQ